MRVLSVVGNRPQFVKSAPLSVALRERGIDEVLLHTGQHYDPELSQVFFAELALPAPRYALGLHTADPAAMQPPIVEAIRDERPDWVLVYGDTNSTVAGARAARDGDVPVAHVEAGLRSGDLSMPEERNRIEVDSFADLLLCPDERSRETLAREGAPGRAEVVGDVMADASMRLAPIARRRSRLLGELELAAHVRLLRPLGYLDLAALASRARVIVTDSGGLQKEAYWYGVPCVTARPSTEWIDTVDAGANVLVDDDPDLIERAVAEAAMPADPPPLYGDGRAAGRIADALCTLFAG